ncbi:hypothetical protein YC2023_020247 [Brassica napus]
MFFSQVLSPRFTYLKDISEKDLQFVCSFPIYDGHGGCLAAEFAKKHLHLNVFQLGYRVMDTILLKAQYPETNPTARSAGRPDTCRIKKIQFIVSNDPSHRQAPIVTRPSSTDSLQYSSDLLRLAMAKLRSDNHTHQFKFKEKKIKISLNQVFVPRLALKLKNDQALTALDLEFNTALCKKDITFLGFFLVGIPERVLYIQVLKHLSVHQVFDQMSERNQYRDIFCFFWIYWQSIETIELLGKLRCISTLCV